MECATCPYGKEEYERRERFSKECRILYNKTDEDDTDIFHDIFCDKTGGKVSIWGYCEDVNHDISKHKNHSKKKKRSKRERDLKYKKHLKYLAKNNWFPSPAFCTNGTWVKGHGWIENSGTYYYKRLYRGKNSSYLKKASNRKIRQYKGELSNGYYCHRLFDFWWKMY